MLHTDVTDVTKPKVQGWVPPSASTGSRRPSAPRRRSSTRGAAILFDDNREIVNESTLEANTGACLAIRREFVKIRDQWPVVTYHDEFGEVHTHTFDWHVVRADGCRFAIANKPSELVVSSGLQKVLSLIKQQRAHRAYADGIALITENECNASDAANANNILRARRARDATEIRIAMAEVSQVRGTVLFGELIQNAPVRAYRRNALWSLIDLGLLRPCAREKIIARTKMWVNHAAMNKEAA